MKDVTDLMDIDAGTHAPPPAALHLGLADLHLRAGDARPSSSCMFRPDGTPVRARLR